MLCFLGLLLSCKAAANVDGGRYIRIIPHSLLLRADPCSMYVNSAILNILHCIMLSLNYVLVLFQSSFMLKRIKH